ncbi:unnamed protein product, partial [Schistosoma turkestanicum]
DYGLTKTFVITVSSTLVRMNESLGWSDSLLDPNSSLYQEYATEICDLLLNSMKSNYIKGIINVTCTVVGFSRGSVVGSAVLAIEYNTTSENFSSTEVTKDTVQNAIVEYVAELITNGSDNVYFDTTNNLTIEAVIDVTTSETTTESQITETHRTTINSQCNYLYRNTPNSTSKLPYIVNLL